MKKVVIYSGRFQPMLKHHADVYAAVQRAFPDAEVYVATSDKTDPPKSPFNFQEKQSIITAHGIPADHVIRVTSPYSWNEYADKFDGTKTILIYAVGGKDTDRFKFNLDADSGLNLKKDGSVAHVQPLASLKEDPKPMTERSYVYFIPTLMSNSGEELSASKFREEFKKAPNLAAAKKLYTKQFGQYNEHVFNLILSKLKGKSDMTEQLNKLLALAGLAEAGPPVHFGQDGDPAKAQFVAGSSSAASMSIANRFPEDVDLNDPQAKKEEFLKALVMSPAALLAEINGRLDPKDHNSLQVGERLNEIISQLESGSGALSSLSADDKSFTVALTANAVKNMALTRGDTGAAPEAEEEELKDSFDLDELRVRAGISQSDESMSESGHDEDDDDDDEPSTFKDEWGRDTQEQDQWKKNVTGKKNKQGMSESEDDDDESVYYDDEDDDNWEAGIDWDEEEDADDEEDYVDEGMSESPNDDDDESVGYDDEDDNNWEAGIDWDEEEDADDEEDYVDEQAKWRADPATRAAVGRQGITRSIHGIDDQLAWRERSALNKSHYLAHRDIMGQDKKMPDTGRMKNAEYEKDAIARNIVALNMTPNPRLPGATNQRPMNPAIPKTQRDYLDHAWSDANRDYMDTAQRWRSELRNRTGKKAGPVWKKERPVWKEAVEQIGEENLPMVKLSDIMKDYGLTEASKPDFLDMDKDGDKKEPMKKAVKDAEKKSHDKKDKTKESVEEHISTTTENAVQQALSELRKLAGL